MSTYQHDAEHDDGMVHVHVHPASVYYKVFGALVLFTLITVGLSRIHLGEWNFFIAVVIATVKAALVVLFFMHVKYASRLTKIFVCAAFLWLAILFGFTFADYLTRDWLPVSRGWVEKETGAPAQAPRQVTRDGH